jgi:hypothetical protein
MPIAIEQACDGCLTTADNARSQESLVPDVAPPTDGALPEVASLFPFPLVIPRSTHYARLGVAPEATADEIRAAAAKLEDRLRARGATAEEFAEAHAVNLESPQERAAYDAAHPPLPLMRLEPTWNPVFDDKTACLAVLRRELERFLLSAGETVHHPADTTRTDFTADFTPTPMLDAQEPA